MQIFDLGIHIEDLLLLIDHDVRDGTMHDYGGGWTTNVFSCYFPINPCPLCYIQMVRSCLSDLLTVVFNSKTDVTHKV